jgi:hypothetical protein
MGCCASNDAMPGYHQNGPGQGVVIPGVTTGGNPTGDSMDLALMLTATGKKPFTLSTTPSLRANLARPADSSIVNNTQVLLRLQEAH